MHYLVEFVAFAVSSVYTTLQAKVSLQIHIFLSINSDALQFLEICMLLSIAKLQYLSFAQELSVCQDLGNSLSYDVNGKHSTTRVD